MADPTIVSLWDEETAHFEIIHRRRKPFHGIDVARCPTCGTAWLRGVDCSLFDVEVLRRLNAGELAAIEAEDGWPPDFDTYEVLRLCREAGYQFSWRDPERGSLPPGSLPLASRTAMWVMGYIARERPGIKVSALADVLGMDRPTAAIIAKRAVDEEGVSIRFDSAAI
jgi:hypothetical protein